MRQVPIARRRPRKLRPALGTVALTRRPGLLALMTQQIAKGAELAAVAAVLPALGFGPLVQHADGGRAVGVAAERFAGEVLGHAVAADEGRGVAHAGLAGGVHGRTAAAGVAGVGLRVHVGVVEVGRSVGQELALGSCRMRR